MKIIYKFLEKKRNLVFLRKNKMSKFFLILLSVGVVNLFIIKEDSCIKTGDGEY